MKYLFNKELTNVEKEIAQYLYVNSKVVYNQTITQVATTCNVSPSTITKYANKIGFTGFKELRYQLQRDQVDIIQNKSVEFHQNQMNQFFEMFNVDLIENLAKLIMDNDQIILWGAGPSRKVAEYFQDRLRIASGKRVVSYNDMQTYEMDLKSNLNSIVIILSASGKNDKIQKKLSMAKKTKATVVFISEAIVPQYIDQVALYINLLPAVEEYNYEVIRGRSLFFIYLEILIQHLINENL